MGGENVNNRGRFSDRLAMREALGFSTRLVSGDNAKTISRDLPSDQQWVDGWPK